MGRGLQYEGVGVQIYDPVVILKPHRVSLGDFTRLDSFIKIEGGEGVTLGRWVHVSSFVHLGVGGGALVVGDGAAFASGARVLTGSARPDGLSMSAATPRYRQHVVRGTTTIGANAFVATNAVILNGVTLGEGAVAAAGSVVTHDMPAFEIWAGVPARKIGERKRPAAVEPPAQTIVVAPPNKAEVTTALLAGIDEMETWG